eukprot:15512504-Heterocapsa_arctica.AAC.1
MAGILAHVLPNPCRQKCSARSWEPPFQATGKIGEQKRQAGRQRGYWFPQRVGKQAPRLCSPFQKIDRRHAALFQACPFD